MGKGSPQRSQNGTKTGSATANTPPSPPPSEAALFPLHRRISLVHPVIAKVVGDIQHLHIGEAQLVQPPERRPDIGTFVPWAASAIQNDVPVLGQRRHLVLQRLD